MFISSRLNFSFDNFFLALLIWFTDSCSFGIMPVISFRTNLLTASRIASERFW